MGGRGGKSGRAQEFLLRNCAQHAAHNGGAGVLRTMAARAATWRSPTSSFSSSERRRRCSPRAPPAVGTGGGVMGKVMRGKGGCRPHRHGGRMRRGYSRTVS